MKERPILFTPGNVVAILEDRKSQTRRVIEPQPPTDGRWHPKEHGGVPGLWIGYTPDGKLRNDLKSIDCPYGAPRDRLWVREATESYPLPHLLTGEPTSALCGRYRADKEPVLTKDEFDLAWWYSKSICPAIHMPRWASRIALEITQVRIERVQDISGKDAIAEGIERDTSIFLHAGWKLYPESESMTTSAIESYRSLWDSINKKRGFGWDTNPWVWALSFTRIK